MGKDKKWLQQSKITFVIEQRDWQQLMESFLKILVWLKTLFFTKYISTFFLPDISFFTDPFTFFASLVLLSFIFLYFSLSLFFLFLTFKIISSSSFSLFLIFDSFFLTFLQFLFKALSLSLVLLYLYLPLLLAFSLSRFPFSSFSISLWLFLNRKIPFSSSRSNQSSLLPVLKKENERRPWKT